MFNFRKIGETSGFTLLELLIVMGLFATLSAFAAVNLLKPQSQSDIFETASLLSSDIKNQQFKTMSGVDNKRHGVKFETGRYILFSGEVYDPVDTSNVEVPLDLPIVISEANINNSEILFMKNGEIENFVDSQNTVTVENSSNGESNVIRINRYGAIETD